MTTKLKMGLRVTILIKGTGNQYMNVLKRKKWGINDPLIYLVFVGVLKNCNSYWVYTASDKVAQFIIL